jgi:hypothetical protein
VTDLIEADKIYLRIRHRARQIIIKYPPPAFYQDFPSAIRQSEEFFETNPVISRLRMFVADRIDNDLGHGFDHAVKVSLDAGGVMIIECGRSGYPKDFTYRRLLLVQCAGLLHDIQRKSENHAVKGALYAADLLKSYPLEPDEIGDVCQAIRNHEAFKEPIPVNSPEGLLVSDCLYDADKFRWGPDNFSDTIWHMVSFYRTPLKKFVEFYPSGMEKLVNIKSTFRTRTGRQYGPQFIDLGLCIGEELLHVIQTEFII